MKIGDLYLFPAELLFGIIPKKSIGLLTSKEPYSDFTWIYQFFFPLVGERYWFTDVELGHARKLTREA